MIIFVLIRRRCTDSHFKWAFTCRALFWINWLNVFAVSSLRLWFRQLSFTACSAMKIAFHISGVIGISERRRYIMVGRNDSWTALLKTTFAVFISLSFKFAEGKIFVFQTIESFFVVFRFFLTGKLRHRIASKLSFHLKGVINRKFWNCMTT